MRIRMPQLSRRWRERINRWNESSLRYLLYPWFALVNGCSWVVQSIGKAWGSRNLRSFIQGLPALAAACGVIVVLVFVFQARGYENRSNLATTYLRMGSEAFGKEDFALAKQCFEKSLHLDPTKDLPKFLLALTCQRSNEMDRCIALMRKLAPADSNGYSPAHRWVGDFICTNFTVAGDAVRAAENHYLRAYNTAPAGDNDRIAAAMRLGRMYQGMKRFDDAIRYIEETAGKVPRQRIMLANIYLEREKLEQSRQTVEIAKGNREQADDAATAAKKYRELKLRAFTSSEMVFKDKAERNLDDKEARLMWAFSLTGQEKFKEAIEVLRKGLVTSSDTLFQEAVSSVFAEWELWLAAKPGNNLADRFGAIQEGLTVFPRNPALLARLIAFSELKGAEGEQAQKLVAELHAKRGNTAAPILDWLMGQKAYHEGRTAEAQQLWEKALATNQNWAIVANNLAWVLAHNNPPELDRALAIIEKVVKQGPGVPQFRGTRREIYAKMGKHKEAITDLELGLTAHKDHPSLLESLAMCYEKTGNATLAAATRAKIEEIKKKQVKPVAPLDLIGGTPPASPADAAKPAPSAGAPKDSPLPPGDKPKEDKPKEPPPLGDKAKEENKPKEGPPPPGVDY